MKAAELQIGDWVKIKGHLDYDKVREIARDENMQWYISFSCSASLFRAYEFEPIILTSEILEKNGWWFDTEDTWRHDEVNFAIEKWNGRYQCYGINQIKLYSVHQLQRALRCCGLRDIADNFVV